MCLPITVTHSVPHTTLPLSPTCTPRLRPLHHPALSAVYGPDGLLLVHIYRLRPLHPPITQFLPTPRSHIRSGRRVPRPLRTTSEAKVIFVTQKPTAIKPELTTRRRYMRLKSEQQRQMQPCTTTQQSVCHHRAAKLKPLAHGSHALQGICT